MSLLSVVRPFAEPLILIVALVLAGVYYRKYRDARTEIGSLADRYAQQVRLNDSTVAQLAQSRLNRAGYTGLLAAEDALHGKLIAAVKLQVAARDTVVVHDTIPTELLPDSTRTATFHDSTFAGIITGTVTAPPCCQPLAVAYRIHRPPFAPSVGFVETGSRTVAVVTWQGERAEIDSVVLPYANLPTRPKRFSPYVAGLIDPHSVLTAQGGALFRLFGGLSLTAQVEQRVEVGQPLRVGVGFRKEW